LAARFLEKSEYRTMHVTEATAEKRPRSDLARLERTLRVSIRLMQRGQRDIQRQRKDDRRIYQPAAEQTCRSE
jgi:hypothetical protein